MKEIITNVNFISIGLSTLSILLVLILLIRSMRKTRYDSIERKIILDDIRRSYENQIYRLNDKMTSSKERWSDVNHLLLRDEILNSKDDYFRDFPRIKPNRFLISNGINESDLIIDKRAIFVLTPFNPAYQKDFYIIKNTCDEVGFICYRGDEEFFSSDIFSQVLKMIVQSRLVIANINGRNPNVLYELGIAQALDKPTILITKTPEEIPIDLKSKRFIVYRHYEDLQISLKKELIKILNE